jgi:polyisoprenoid-binding protein YceI
MLHSFRKIIITFIFILIPTFANADVTAWQIVPEQSSITFTASQNNAPVTGEFKKFEGNINFDPNQQDKSNVRIIVDVASITTADPDISNTLKTADWFNAKIFPQAIFSATHFVKTGNNTYQADGTLSIRDKSLPVKLFFVLDQYSDTNAAVAKGMVVLKRNDFGVGQGDWVNTDVVKNDVQVNFKITAKK